MFSASKPLLAIRHYMFLLVAEKILVPISVISVIRLRLFVLRHNYLSICSIGRNLCSSGRNMVYSWRWIMGGRGHISYLAYVSNPQKCRNNWLKEIWLCLFIKRLWASQTSENIFYKTKVVPFEILILKNVNKLKLDNDWPSYDPSNKACFFHFLNSLKEIRSRLFIKLLWASQTSENILYKTKVFPFEILILKI